MKAKKAVEEKEDRDDGGRGLSQIAGSPSPLQERCREHSMEIYSNL